MTSNTRKTKLLIGANALMAIVLAVAALFSLWKTKGEDMTIMFSLIMLIASIAFFLAFFAAKRQWRGQCYLQLVGPSIVVFALFGTVIAAVAAVIGVIACWFTSCKSGSGGSAAS
jgi:hypothetical protein